MRPRKRPEAKLSIYLPIAELPVNILLIFGLGIAVGFFYFGWMSDLLAPRFGDESLRWAIYTGMGFYVLAAILLIGASRTLKKDWVD